MRTFVVTALLLSASVAARAQSGAADQFTIFAGRTSPNTGRFCAEFEMLNTGSHFPRTMLIGVDYGTGAWFQLTLNDSIHGTDPRGVYFSGDYTGIGLESRPDRNVDSELFGVGALVPALRTRVFLKHQDLVKSAEQVEGGFDVRVVYPNDAIRQITPNLTANITTSETLFHYDASGRVVGSSSTRYENENWRYVYAPDSPPGPLAVPDSGFGNWKLTKVEYNLPSSEFEKDAVVSRARQHVQRNKQIAEERRAAAQGSEVQQPAASSAEVETIAVESSKTWRLTLITVGALIVGAGVLLIYRRRLSA